jgi:hypothetical protein
MLHTQAQDKAASHLYHLGTRGRAIVGVRHGGRNVGLYRVRRVDDGVIILSHGVISFPVGTRLVVEDFQGLIPGAPRGSLAAVVVGNDLSGISLAW